MPENPYQSPHEVGTLVPRLALSQSLWRAAASIAWKLLLPALVFIAGPESNARWGEEYAGPGMNQMDVLLAVMVVSFILAVLLFASFVVTGVWLHSRSLRFQASIDFALFAVALAVAVLAGVTARVT